MKHRIQEAYDKLADLKNYIIEYENIDEDYSGLFQWHTDPFYCATRSIALELMHEGYFDEAWDMLSAYVKYEHPDYFEDAKKDLNNIFDGLIKLDKNNIEELVKKYGGNVLVSDIHYSNSYANYVILSMSEDEIFDYTVDNMQLGNRMEYLLQSPEALINAYLDVYNTELKNYRYPFPL